MTNSPQEVVAPSQHEVLKIIDWEVKPQYKQSNQEIILISSLNCIHVQFVFLFSSRFYEYEHYFYFFLSDSFQVINTYDLLKYSTVVCQEICAYLNIYCFDITSKREEKEDSGSSNGKNQ